MYVISKDDGFHTTVLQAAIDNAQFTLCQWYEKYLEHKYTHYNWNRNSRSMTHWKRGHVIYVDAIHKNYRFQNFLLKLSHNVKNKCEALMSLSAIKSLFKIVVLVLWYNVQVTKLFMNSVMCNVPIVLSVPIITNAVARWRATHVSRLQNVRSIHWTQNWQFHEICRVQWRNWNCVLVLNTR